MGKGGRGASRRDDGARRGSSVQAASIEFFRLLHGKRSGETETAN